MYNALHLWIVTSRITFKPLACGDFYASDLYVCVDRAVFGELYVFNDCDSNMLVILTFNALCCMFWTVPYRSIIDK